MLFLNRIFSVLTLVILAGCGAGNDMRPDASAEVISSASYRHDGPAALTLYTMINSKRRLDPTLLLMASAAR